MGLEQFVIEEEISASLTSVVYRAMAKDGRVVALKSNYKPDGYSVQMRLYRLGHPHLLFPSEVFIEAGRLIEVMDFIEWDKLNVNGNWSFQEANKVIFQVAIQTIISTQDHRFPDHCCHDVLKTSCLQLDLFFHPY